MRSTYSTDLLSTWSNEILGREQPVPQTLCVRRTVANRDLACVFSVLLAALHSRMAGRTWW